MWRNSHLRRFVLSCCAISVLGGCSSCNTVTKLSSAASPSGGTPPVVTTPSGANLPGSIYVVVPNVTTDNNEPASWIFIFSQSTTGSLDDEVQNWEIVGSQVSVDSAGNIYILRGSEIVVIPPNPPFLQVARSLPVGSGTKISSVVNMTASAAGEIFVSDGQGIGVFSATATGNADPTRYIMGSSQPLAGSSTAITPGLIAVDSSDNLYVQNTADSSVDVFGPTDTGNVVPARIIAGPLTHLTGPVSESGVSPIQGMATDAAGDLYVLCLCARADGGTDFGVYEFGPTAKGNVAPIRFVTDPRMHANGNQNGVAVDSAGTIYVSTGTATGPGTIFEFPSSPTDTTTASNTVAVLYGSSVAGIAVH